MSDGPEIEIECPECGKLFDQQLEEIKEGGESKCPHCDVTIKFKVEGKSPSETLDDFINDIRDRRPG